MSIGTSRPCRTRSTVWPRSRSRTRPCPCEPTTRRSTGSCRRLADQRPAGSGPCSKTARALYPRSSERIDQVVPGSARRRPTRGRRSRRRERSSSGVSTTWSKTSSLGSLLDWARPKARFRISASAWLCSSATPIRASGRGRSASTQSSFTLCCGSHAGELTHERLDRHPGQKQRPHRRSHRRGRPATSQLTRDRTDHGRLTRPPSSPIAPTWSSTSLPLSATMIAAAVQARTWPHQGVANSPMFRRFDVK